MLKLLSIVGIGGIGFGLVIGMALVSYVHYPVTISIIGWLVMLVCLYLLNRQGDWRGPDRGVD